MVLRTMPPPVRTRQSQKYVKRNLAYHYGGERNTCHLTDVAFLERGKTNRQLGFHDVNIAAWLLLGRRLCYARRSAERHKARVRCDI